MSAEFVQYTWQMVNSNHPEIGWSEDNTSIIVANPERLATEVLPLYFRHQQYASWVRALNAYDFKKTGPNRWSHPSFIRGRDDLLSNIRRKPPPKAGGGPSIPDSDTYMSTAGFRGDSFLGDACPRPPWFRPPPPVDLPPRNEPEERRDGCPPRLRRGDFKVRAAHPKGSAGVIPSTVAVRGPRSGE